MSKIWIIQRKHVILAAALLLVAVSGVLYLNREKLLPTAAAGPVEERTIHMVTGEFKSTTDDGKTIEAYRWDPGTIVVHKGEHVKLNILGVNGSSHPFLIEGLNVKGEVKKGKTTVVSFTAEQTGTYRLICMTHADQAHNGPMIGYIEVIE